jgi:hypothetical protein
MNYWSLAQKISHTLRSRKKCTNPDNCSSISILLPAQTIECTAGKAHDALSNIENTKDGLHPHVAQNQKAAMVSLHTADTNIFIYLEHQIIRVGDEELPTDAGAENRRLGIAGHLVLSSGLIQKAGRGESCCHFSGELVGEIDQSRARVDDGNGSGDVGFCSIGVSSQSGSSWVLSGLGDRSKHRRRVGRDGEAVHGHRVELVNILQRGRVDADRQDGHGDPAWRKRYIWDAAETQQPSASVLDGVSGQGHAEYRIRGVGAVQVVEEGIVL